MGRPRKNTRRRRAVRTAAVLALGLAVGLLLALTGTTPTVVGAGVALTLVGLVGTALFAVPARTRRRLARPFLCHLCGSRYGNPSAHACRARRVARYHA